MVNSAYKIPWGDIVGYSDIYPIVFVYFVNKCEDYGSVFQGWPVINDKWSEEVFGI